jgi:uncharacterized protein involved in exopolysaccharide biosynthesis
MWPQNPQQIERFCAWWREWSAVLWSRKKLLVSLFAFIITIGAGGLLLRQPLYESSMKILVTRAETLHAERELLASSDVLAAVAQQLSLPDNEAQQCAARLEFVVSEKAPVIQVNYSDVSAAQAEKFLHTLFQTYSAQRLRQQSRPDIALRERSADFNQKLAATTSVLKQFYDVQKQAEAAQIERREIEQRSLALRAQIAAQPEQVETGSSTKYVSALDRMKEELLALELQRTQLQQKYQPNHRLLRDHDQRIAQAKALIAQEEQNPPRERSFARNETRQRLSDALLKAEADLAALAQREQRLSALVREYQTQLSVLNVQGFKKSDLERERAMQENAWRLFEQKAQEAEINAVLNQTHDASVSLVEAPISHSRQTRRAAEVAGLLFVGLVLSVGGTVLTESWHPRLRHEVGLQRRFGLSVLASLPPRQNPQVQYDKQ